MDSDITEFLPMHLRNDDSTEINPVQLLKESSELEKYFDHALHVDVLPETRDEDSDSEGEEEAENLEDESASDRLNDATSESVYAWVDNYILQTRRKGGRQTEKSVIKQWKVRFPTSK